MPDPSVRASAPGGESRPGRLNTNRAPAYEVERRLHSDCISRSATGTPVSAASRPGITQSGAKGWSAGGAPSGASASSPRRERRPLAGRNPAGGRERPGRLPSRRAAPALPLARCRWSARSPHQPPRMGLPPGGARYQCPLPMGRICRSALGSAHRPLRRRVPQRALCGLQLGLLQAASPAFPAPAVTEHDARPWRPRSAPG